MIPENLWPALISLLINVPLTLLTTFLFNERLKNRRVRKDLLIDSLKAALEAIQFELQQIHLLSVNTKALEELELKGSNEILAAEKAKKSELYLSLLGSQAKVQSLFDLIQIQCQNFLKGKQLSLVDAQLESMKGDYSNIWKEAIELSITSMSDEEDLNALKKINQGFNETYRSLIGILDKINTY